MWTCERSLDVSYSLNLHHSVIRLQPIYLSMCLSSIFINSVAAWDRSKTSCRGNTVFSCFLFCTLQSLNLSRQFSLLFTLMKQINCGCVHIRIPMLANAYKCSKLKLTGWTNWFFRKTKTNGWKKVSETKMPSNQTKNQWRIYSNTRNVYITKWKLFKTSWEI